MSLFFFFFFLSAFFIFLSSGFVRYVIPKFLKVIIMLTVVEVGKSYLLYCTLPWVAECKEVLEKDMKCHSEAGTLT